MSEPPSTCPPTAQPNTTPTSRPSTIVSSAGENSPKLPLPPQCENSSSSQTPSCEKIDSGSPDTLDSHHRCSSGRASRVHLPPQGGKVFPIVTSESATPSRSTNRPAAPPRTTSREFS